MKHVPFTLGALATCATFASTAIAQSTEERIDQLQQQVGQLQQQAAQPQAQKVRFNGFLSTGVMVADNDAGYLGATETTNVEDLSLFGLQGAFSLSDNTDVVMQLVARGSNDWEPTIEWAYLSHRVSNSLTARAGRLRLPLFKYSDYLDVGYAQPFARPPAEVYADMIFANHTGVDLTHELQLDNSTLSTQVFYGHSKDADAVIELRNSRGVQFAWSDFVWTLRANFGAGDLAYQGSNLNATFTGIGGSYENGDIQVITEFTQTTIDGFLPDYDSSYITFAKRLGAFTPYVTLSRVESSDDDERMLSRGQAFAAYATPTSPYFMDDTVFYASEVANRERTALSVGTRWDAMSNVAVKFDVTRANGFGDTGGGLAGNIAPTVQYDDATVYTIRIDSAF